MGKENTLNDQWRSKIGEVHCADIFHGGRR